MNWKKVNWEIILLFAVLIFALFLRIYHLGAAPFWIDESISSEASLNILEKGAPVLDSGILYSRALVFHYIQAFFMIFSQGEAFARFISVIFGMLTIVLAYFIGKEYSKSGGIIAALFMAVFFLEVFFSRQARFYQMFQFMFFLSLYLMYKSKKEEKYLYFSLIALLLAYDTQIHALILAPFFILHILLWNKKKWLAVFPLFLLIWKFMPAVGLSNVASAGVNAGAEDIFISFASKYFEYAKNMHYMLVFFIPGLIWAFLKNKRLTLLLVLPSVAGLIVVFSLKLFALRYIYFLVFLLVLYSSLLMAFLYDKYGKIMLISIIALLLIPSNIFFPFNYVNILNPVDYNYNDPSAPWTNYKNLPESLVFELRESNTVIALFSLDFQRYVRKPDYVIPFSMSGRGYDEISYINSKNTLVDKYSGAEILNYSALPEKPYYVISDAFSTRKLNAVQRENFGNLTSNCSIAYSNYDLKIYSCL